MPVRTASQNTEQICRNEGEMPQVLGSAEDTIRSGGYRVICIEPPVEESDMAGESWELGGLLGVKKMEK